VLPAVPFVEPAERTTRPASVAMPHRVVDAKRRSAGVRNRADHASAPEDALINRNCYALTVERVIGEGGMGRVLTGRETDRHSVAQKWQSRCCRSTFSRDPVMIERFHPSGDHPPAHAPGSTVRLVKDFGEDDGQAVLVMEYISGERLAEVPPEVRAFPAGVSIGSRSRARSTKQHRSG